MNLNTENGAAAGHRDPADLEREASELRADELRADMDRTLDALERKFSPSHLLDRSVSYLRDHGGDLIRNLGDTVKQNPVPVLLTAAGLAWLITSSFSSRSRASGDDDDSDDSYGEIDADDPGMREKLAARVREGASAVQQSWRSARVTGRVSSALNATRARAREAQERALTLMEEQPLVVGALAVAAGAIIGAALPTTQYENRTVGPVRDRTLEKAKELGEREYLNLRSKLEPREDVQVSGRAN